MLEGQGNPENSVVLVDDSPVNAMIHAINHQVEASQRRTQKRIDKASRMQRSRSDEDQAIHKLALLRGMGKKPAAVEPSGDVGEGLSAVEAAMAEEQAEAKRAKVKAKVMKALRKAQASMSQAQGAQEQHKVGDILSGQPMYSKHSDNPISDMKRLVAKTVAAGMTKAQVAAPEDPLDAAIDKITIVRNREKTKDNVRKQLAQAQHSMDLAESNDEVKGSSVDSYLQVLAGTFARSTPGAGSGMPAAAPAPPGPKNKPVAEVNKETPPSKPLARSTPQAPSGGSGLSSALSAAKGTKSSVSTKKVPEKADPKFSKEELEKAARKIQEYAMSDKDATKEGEKQNKPWDEKKKTKSRKVSGPAMPKVDPKASGSGAGSSKLA